jgi:hypothetical protein
MFKVGASKLDISLYMKVFESDMRGLYRLWTQEEKKQMIVWHIKEITWQVG